jgi:hypothetical protein
MSKKSIYFSIEVTTSDGSIYTSPTSHKVAAVFLHVYAAIGPLDAYSYHGPLSDPEFLKDGETLKPGTTERLESAVEWTILSTLNHNTILHHDLTSRPIEKHARAFLDHFLAALQAAETPPALALVAEPETEPEEALEYALAATS